MKESLDELRIKFSFEHYGVRAAFLFFFIIPFSLIALGVILDALGFLFYVNVISIILVFVIFGLTLYGIWIIVRMFNRQTAIIMNKDYFYDNFSKYKKLEIAWEDVEELKLGTRKDDEGWDIPILIVVYNNLYKYKDQNRIHKINKEYDKFKKVEVRVDVAELNMKPDEYRNLEKYFFIVKSN